MQTCIRETNFDSGNLAVKIRDGNKKKQKNWVTTSLTISWNVTLIWLICYFKRITPDRQKRSCVVVCSRRHPEILLCVVSFLSVQSAGLRECGVARCGAALQAWNSSFLPGISWLSDLPTQLSELCLYCWHLLFIATVSPLKDFTDPLHILISYFSRCHNTWQYRNFTSFSFAILGVAAWLLLYIS